MLSADQIAVFLAVVDEGSFSAAGRLLRRQQSAISYAIGSLEDRLGVKLFDRSSSRPRLTSAGAALVTDARKVADSLAAMRDRGNALARGIEAEIGVAVDAFCPLPIVADALADFASRFPGVRARIHVELRHQVLRLVGDGICQLAVLIHPMGRREDLEQIPMREGMQLRPYVGRYHPLALAGARLENSALGDYIQFTLADRDGVSTGQELGVFTSRTWPCSDLRMTLALIRAGIGWGFVPDELARRAVELGEIVPLYLAAWPDGGIGAGKLVAVHHVEAALGPGATWLLDRFVAGPATG